MNKQNIQLLFKYNQWANAKIFNAASKLTVEQFTASDVYPHGGIRSTLTHALFAEWVWRNRWQGISPTARLNPEDFPTFESLQTRWFQEETALMKFIADVTDEKINSVFHYTSLEGVKFENVLWESMLHMINHGTQHRGEVAQMLTNFNLSPGDIDMILFLRKKI